MDNSVTKPILMKKGAEASLYLGEWNNRQVVFKVRLPKKYRPEKLDITIRNYRTIHEPQLIHDAKAAGVTTPIIYLVNVSSSTITMEYIQGKQVKKLFDEAEKTEREKLSRDIGELIGKLHLNCIIHGDLTTSNMIKRDDDGKIFLIDFGLGEKSEEIEAKGVDLHLMKQALQSTHYQHAAECFEAVITGYRKILGETETERILQKIKEIERRGRYIAERKEK